MAITGLAPLMFAHGLAAPAFLAAMGLTAVAVALSPVGARVVAPQMTWTGDNWDVATGVVALLAAPFARRVGVAWAANLVGTALLLNVARVVARSAPGPLLAYPEPLLLAFHFPTVWIASVCVVGAMVGRVVTFRAFVRR